MPEKPIAAMMQAAYMFTGESAGELGAGGFRIDERLGRELRRAARRRNAGRITREPC
jgi:hypothetical protein